MSFDNIVRQFGKTKIRCLDCGVLLGETIDFLKEAPQIEALRSSLGGHCPRCKKELNQKTSRPFGINLDYRVKNLKWKFNHAFEPVYRWSLWAAICGTFLILNVISPPNDFLWIFPAWFIYPFWILLLIESLYYMFKEGLKKWT